MLGLEISDLCKRFPDGTKALSGVCLNVEPGEGVMLIGANGSGKSTLLNCILRLEEATSGSILVGDVDTVKAGGRVLRDVRRKVGMIFQKFNLVGNLSVFHNVLHGALGRSKGAWCWMPQTAPREERQRAMESLERVGLESLADRRVDTLSGGQRQRVALARMLMQGPELILADEPVSSLDPKAGQEVMDLLWEIGRERRMTVLCTIHSLDLTLQYAERVIGLRSGLLAVDTAVSETSSQELKQLYERVVVQEPAASS